MLIKSSDSQGILLSIISFLVKEFKRHFNAFILLTFASTATIILVLSIILADITYKGTRLFLGEVPDVILEEQFKEVLGEIRMPSMLYEDDFNEGLLDKLSSEGDKEKLLFFYKEGEEEYLGGLFTKTIYVRTIGSRSDEGLNSLLKSVSYNVDIEKVLLDSYVYSSNGEYVFKNYLIDFLSSYGSFVESSYEIYDKELLSAYNRHISGEEIGDLPIGNSEFEVFSFYLGAYNSLSSGKRARVSEVSYDIIKDGFSLIEFKHTPLSKFIAGNPSSGMKKGGIFPAIFGTVALVIIMSIAVIPLGVITALYLTEYAGENRITRLIRLAIHNLAGVPAIVFGLFGLGFFIQFMGKGIDLVIYGGELVYGQPAILWSALVLALLTLPVVIVSTEEALRNIPADIRHASYALGATKFQTILRLIIPNAMSGILTGSILAVSRGVGEVAPILFTGAAYFLEELPVGLNYQFMELGYHIYILATQSPNVEEVKPVLYSTVFILLLLTFFLNLLAIIVRLRMRRKFKGF